MTYDHLVAALGQLHPDIEWSYTGDGSTLEPTHGPDGTLVSRGLEWHSDTPPPTLGELAAVVVAAPAGVTAGVLTVDQASGLAAIAALNPKTATVADVIAAAGGAA